MMKPKKASANSVGQAGLKKILGDQPMLTIPHDFRLDRAHSEFKGKLFKSLSGFMMIADENKIVYHCVRCDSDITLEAECEVDALNMQIAEKFSCKA